MKTIIYFRAEHYSGGTSYVPQDRHSEYLMQHCLNTDMASINHHGMEKLKVVAEAHGWEVQVA